MNKTKLSDDDLKAIADRKLAQLVAQLCAADENVSIVLEYASTGDLIMTNIKKEEEDENEPKPSTSKEVKKLTKVFNAKFWVEKT